MKKIILLISLFVSVALYSQQIIPYLQNPAPDSIRINWVSEDIEALNNLKVIYGESTEKLTMRAIGDYVSFLDLEDGYKQNYFYCNAILKKLKPDTRYFYKIINGSAESQVYSFRTQPKNGSKDIFRFLILGDHQLPDDRYIRLMKAAKEVCEDKYGAPIENHIRFITNVGDQVDNSSLKQYKEIHFKQSELLSPNLPITTIIGNHETYGTLGLKAYENHFFYDDTAYKGIKSGTDFYYAFQSGRVLFLMMSSEPIHTNDTQLAWAKKVIETAKSDSEIDWILSYNHRPIQAEQYIGDISVWVRDQIIPLLQTTHKSVLNVGGHHHIYHKGILRDYPMYHIISGGASWDQRWGMSREKEFDDVEKTIDYFPFQVVEFDPAKQSMTVETYVIGNEKEKFEKVRFIDKFVRVFGQEKPQKPSVINIKENQEIKLPFIFESSQYKSNTAFGHNSIQFQIASKNDFVDPKLDMIRYCEKIYGPHDEGKLNDINKFVDIFRLKVDKDILPSGEYYIRIRHRDNNIEWSPWSDIVRFKLVN